MSEEGRQEIPLVKGLRHVALKVTNLEASKTFYQTWFGMRIVWEPDAENVYMSSGIDNLALHQIPNEQIPRTGRDTGNSLTTWGLSWSHRKAWTGCMNGSSRKGSRLSITRSAIETAVIHFTWPIPTVSSSRFYTNPPSAQFTCRRKGVPVRGCPARMT